jgi:hypothetical protein
MCPVCGAEDHEERPKLFGVFPVVVCPRLRDQLFVVCLPVPVPVPVPGKGSGRSRVADLGGIEGLEALQRRANELREARRVAAVAVGPLPRLSWWGRRWVRLRVWWRRVLAR